MEKEIILPPGYYNEKDAEEVYEKSFDTVFRYFSTNFMSGNLLVHIKDIQLEKLHEK